MRAKLIFLILALVACTDSTAPQEEQTTRYTAPQLNLSISGASISDLSGPCYQAANQCLQPGIYQAGGVAEGSNSPPSWMQPQPTPPGLHVAVYGVSNMVIIYDSLAVRMPGGTVNCAASGMTIDLLADINHAQHATCAGNLAAVGLTADSVGLVIIQPLLKNPTGALEDANNWGDIQASDAYRLRGHLLQFAATVKALYPNAVIGVVGRAFAHDGAWSLHAEPFPLEEGYGIRMMMAVQQAGTQALTFWLAYIHDPSDPLDLYKPTRGSGLPDLVHPSAKGAGVRAQSICDGVNNSPFLPWITCPPITGNATGNATWVCDPLGCDFILTVNGQQTAVRLP